MTWRFLLTAAAVAAVVYVSTALALAVTLVIGRTNQRRNRKATT